ncbi:host cell division inhibitor Icd-like protein [Mannheimia sp. AT1]|uniref:Host cell division inhibitor Icd-like protein n=1 Tax=Mannheimia cairinae TaxID=3025936 RepID=A0ABT5MNN8_9PAST|nr:host cell division inhibitor Icd-like protein [Mannheimia cairinae]MDD0823101.1 host cell division inhibitor Icd-like protein [Mannheimia cairinae]MDD0825874.1 host cell division inhibitor Icd-like protein [Mannheimia cairinae]
MKELFPNQKQYNLNSAILQKNFTLLLTTFNRSPYANHAFAKSRAETANSNIQTANSCTPLNRAFFVRSSRTPKERLKMACSSMVACSGKGFALCCFPFETVLQLVARYRQITLQSEAIDPKNQQTELSAMNTFAYSFLCVNRTSEIYQEEIVRVIANNEQNARFQLSADYRLLLAHPIAKIRLKPTACTAKGGIYA